MKDVRSSLLFVHNTTPSIENSSLIRSNERNKVFALPGRNSFYFRSIDQIFFSAIVDGENDIFRVSIRFLINYFSFLLGWIRQSSRRTVVLHSFCLVLDQLFCHSFPPLFTYMSYAMRNAHLIHSLSTRSSSTSVSLIDIEKIIEENQFVHILLFVYVWCVSSQVRWVCTCICSIRQNFSSLLFSSLSISR